MPSQGIRRGKGRGVMGRGLLLALAALLGVLALAACGKKGPPSPIGPPDQIIYPRSYPVPPKPGVPPQT